MTNSTKTPAQVRDRAATVLATAAGSVRAAAVTADQRVRPLLVRLGRSLALLAWRMWLALGPALRNAGRAVTHGLQRVEEVVVPALLRAARAVPRGVQRAEELLVPALINLGRAATRGLERAERRLVPGLAGAGVVTAGAVSRGQSTVSSALTSGGRGLVEGMQRLQAAATPVLSPRRTAGEPGDPTDPDQPRWETQVEGEYVPSASDLRAPTPRRLAVRDRFRGALVSLVGLLATAALVVLVVSVMARETVGAAVQSGTQAVGVELRLPEDAGLQELFERSYIYASNGQTTLDVLDQDWNRRIVELEDIPPLVRLAIVTAEDKRFYEHNGYDIEGIGRAAVTNIQQGSISQGGSTITQQLAKTAVGSERDGLEGFMRKAEELAYAVALEERFTKDELLEQYLNGTFFGERSYGVAAAAEEYFGITDLSQLQVEHGALLAAMIRSPNSANPRTDPEVALSRRNAILDLMVSEGHIPREQADAAKALPLGVQPRTSEDRPYDFIADSVRREYLTQPEFAQFGATVDERETRLLTGGLRIYSSLDPRMQEIAEEILAQAPLGSDPTRPTGAIVTVDPTTGRILAAHSGLDYEVEQLAIPTQGRRQLGSSAKPFVYAQALREGIPPDIALSGNSPQYFENIPGWTRRDGGLENYENSSYGPMNMADALRRSVNTATVQLAFSVGVPDIVGLQAEMGINTEAATNGQITPAIALGGYDEGVTPLEAAAAYAVFANEGIYVKPHFIDRIEDRNGNPLYEARLEARQVLTPEQNAQMVEMMEGVVTGGTATNARLPGWEVAGKTGTTQDNRDAWFVGYTPTLATAVWTGVARDPASAPPLRWTGGRVPAQVWQQYMARALEGQTPVPFPDIAIPEGRLAPGQPVTVPDVTGVSQGDALQALGNAQLFGEVRQVPSRARRGTVVSQNPRAGEAATTGDTVTLSVSSGQPAPSPTPAPPAQGQPEATVPPAAKPTPTTPGAVLDGLDLPGRRDDPPSTAEPTPTPAPTSGR